MIEAIIHSVTGLTIGLATFFGGKAWDKRREERKVEQDRARRVHELQNLVYELIRRLERVMWVLQSIQNTGSIFVVQMLNQIEDIEHFQLYENLQEFRDILEPEMIDIIVESSGELRMIKAQARVYEQMGITEIKRSNLFDSFHRSMRKYVKSLYHYLNAKKG